MGKSDAKRPTAIEDENAKLKNFLFDSMLDSSTVKNGNSRMWRRPPLKDWPSLAYVKCIM